MIAEALAGKLVLLTGASGTVGRALAHGMADAGAKLALTGRDRDALEQLAAQLGDRAAGVHVVDFASEAAADALFDEIEAVYERIDVLINNAGRASAARFGQVDAREFLDVLTVNLVVPFLCVQRAAPIMRSAGGGKVLNIGSIYGSVAVDRRLYDDAPAMVQGSVPYVASKSALVNLTRDLAVQLAPWNIQVNMLSPGGVRADQPAAFRSAYEQRTPLARMAEPEDFPGAAVFLCSAAANYVTGQNVLVDGGFTAW